SGGYREEVDHAAAEIGRVGTLKDTADHAGFKSGARGVLHLSDLIGRAQIQAQPGAVARSGGIEKCAEVPVEHFGNRIAGAVVRAWGADDSTCEIGRRTGRSRDGGQDEDEIVLAGAVRGRRRKHTGSGVGKGDLV